MSWPSFTFQELHDRETAAKMIIFMYFSLWNVDNSNNDFSQCTLLSIYATTKALDEPVKWLIDPRSDFEAPKWLIRYTPETADSGILHSIVAKLSGLSFAGLDHLNRRLKSSSS